MPDEGFDERLVPKESLPLFGKSVLFTTPRSYAGGLAGLLTERSARPVWMPTIEIWPMADYHELDESISDLSQYDWIAFTSVNGIEAFHKRLLALGRTTASIRPTMITAFGPDAEALKPFKIKADLIPPKPSPKSMVEALTRIGITGRRVLVPVPEVSGVPEPRVVPEFIEEMKNAGAIVCRVPAYRTMAVTPKDVEAERQMILNGEVDAVVVTSSAEILSLLRILGDGRAALDRTVMAYMGAATAKTGADVGLRQDIIPTKPAMAGLVEAIEDYFRHRSSGSSRWHWPARLNLVAMSGVGVEVAKSWSGLFGADTGVKIHVAIEDNAVNKFKWVGLGLFDLTAAAPAETAQMLMADRRYAVRDGGPFPIRAVWAHSRSTSGFFVRGDSHIRTVYDVKPGVRIADISGYLASNRMVEAFLAWAKVDRNEVVWMPCKDFRENVAAVVGGRADLSFGVPTSPVLFEADKNPHGLRWIELDPVKDTEGAQRFWAVSPLIRFGRVTFGVRSAIGVCSAYGTSLYVTRAQTDTELVYRLAKWLDENHGRYKAAHIWNQQATCEALAEELDHTFRPCHDGLIRYLRKKGLWTAAHEARQAENVLLVERYCRAYQEARDLADEKNMTVSPDNGGWVRLWEEYRQKLGIPPVRNLPSLREKGT